MKKYTIKPLVWSYFNGNDWEFHTADSVEEMQVKVFKETGAISYGYIHETSMKARTVQEAKASCQAQHECRVQQFLDEVTE